MRIFPFLTGHSLKEIKLCQIRPMLQWASLVKKRRKLMAQNRSLQVWFESNFCKILLPESMKSVITRVVFSVSSYCKDRRSFIFHSSFTNRSMEKPFMCGVCKKPFQSFPALTFHTQSHPSTPKCTVINGSFRPCPVSACLPRVRIQCDVSIPVNEFHEPKL